MRLGPVVAELTARGIPHRVVHTGQRPLPDLPEELALDFGSDPDQIWHLPSDPNRRIGALFGKAMSELTHNRPDVVVAAGDSWAAPAAALAASRAGVGFAHVEAGLRSRDAGSAEEANRKVAGALAHLHLAPTPAAAANLRAEGVAASHIVVTGNPVTDAVARTGARRVPVEQRSGVLLSTHTSHDRHPSDRDDAVARIAEQLAGTCGPVTVPIHPLVRTRLDAAGLWDPMADNCIISEPLDYFSLVSCLANSALLVTDSERLQEEAAWLGVPVVIMRSSTPRHEGVDLGLATLAGPDVDAVVEAATAMADPATLRRVAAAPCPYGDGNSAARIVDAILEASDDGRLPFERDSASGELLVSS